MNETRYREAERLLWESYGALPTERWCNLSRLGTKVRVLEVGGGPAVIFVHGGNISGSSWAGLVARLSGFRCILVDRPGCGLSPSLVTPVRAEGLDQFAETFFLDLLDSLELKSAHVVATSFGAQIALRAAAALPGRIDRMVLFGWSFGASRRLPGFMRMTGVPGVARLMTAMPVNPRAVRMIFRSIGHGPTLKAGRLTEADLAWYLSLLRDTETLRTDVASAQSLISARRGLTEPGVLSDALLAKVTNAVYLLWGESDPFGGSAVAHAFAARLPHAELELLPAAGHAPWLDASEHCADTTRKFLSP